jgi:bifunctional UDP-N-acetylglucosamine pyrophosphorylase/glucosamine-1-phosphate N-acetyltransferase
MINAHAVTIILAAGLGTRMHSERPKVLHEVAGREMILHVLSAAEDAGLRNHHLVVGPEGDEVTRLVQKHHPNAKFSLQKERRGTGHAVLTACGKIGETTGAIFILFGDMPLLSGKTITAMGEALSTCDLVVASFRPDDPAGYGRIMQSSSGGITAIREHRDATDVERQIDLCFSGLLCLRSSDHLSLLERINNHNAQDEFYLTDLVEIAVAEGLKVSEVEVDPVDVAGVNTRLDLADAEHLMQTRLRKKALSGGVTLIAPESVYFSYDTKIGRDVIVEPQVHFATGVTIEDNVRIRGFSHLEGARVETGAIIGPFARLRPGAHIGTDVHIGNYVEIKNAVVDEGAKINHLAYIGDAHVGARANIGAGTITCNYDGFAKHHTEIGSESFVGSNSSLVAPVKVGVGAYVASGSVVTENIEDDTLAIGRARQINKGNWAEKFRALHTSLSKDDACAGED